MASTLGTRKSKQHGAHVSHTHSSDLSQFCGKHESTESGDQENTDQILLASSMHSILSIVMDHSMTSLDSQVLKNASSLFKWHSTFIYPTHSLLYLEGTEDTGVVLPLRPLEVKDCLLLHSPHNHACF